MFKNDQATPSFNRELLFSNFHGIEDMIPEIIECFLISVPKLNLVLETAIQHKNFEAIEISANTLKGFLANFCAEPSKLIAAEIEKMGHKKNIEHADEKFRQLCFEITKLKKELQDLALESALIDG